MNILLLNGPNLNMLGRWKTEIHGTEKLEQLVARMEQKAKEGGYTLVARQSNSEGQLIDWIHQFHLEREKVSGIIINAGELSYTSTALCEALRISQALHPTMSPTIEVRLRDPRVSFRGDSVISGACNSWLAEAGTDVYLRALDIMIKYLKGEL